jgi:hypothetical protein
VEGETRSIPTLASSIICSNRSNLGGSKRQWLTKWLTVFGLLQVGGSTVDQHKPAKDLAFKHCAPRIDCRKKIQAFTTKVG